MGVGFAIIANSRPYEGVFFAIPICIALILWMRRPTAPPFRIIASRVITPLFIMLALTLGSMGYYFWRTTGSSLQTPYAVNAKAYFSVPFFPWQSAVNRPVYRHAIMQNFYLGWVASEYDFCRMHPFVSVLLRGWLTWFFFLGPLLTAPLICVCFVLPYSIRFTDFSDKTRLLLLVCGCVGLGSLLPIGFDPHYIAPITAAVFALLLIALSNVRRWKPFRRPSGIAVVRFILPLAVMALLIRAATPSIAQTTPATWYSPFISHTYREQIERQLSETIDRHLIIVRYKPEHIVNDEWVYNEANIDAAKIVWARDMGTDKNLELIHYFKDRKVWLVEPDVLPPKLTPYPNAENVRSIAEQSSTNHEVR